MNSKKFPQYQTPRYKNTAIDPEKILANSVQDQANEQAKPFDTTVYLSIDHEKRISSATSTSGWAWKYPKTW